MHFKLVAVGRIRESYVAAACDDFRGRLRRNHTLEEIEVAAARGDRPDEAMRDEGERVLARIDPSETVWLLERTGEAIDSVAVATRLRRLADGGTQRLTLVVAGTYGASDALLARATWRWSLSPLTLLHEWARMLVLEQLHRATKIDRGEPYHH